HQVPAGAGEHRPHVVEVFLGRGADAGAVLEDAARVGLTGQHGDGELVGVEVPGVRHARGHHVQAQPGQRVGVFVQFVAAEAVGDEALEVRVDVEPVDQRVGGDAVARDEGV